MCLTINKVNNGFQHNYFVRKEKNEAIRILSTNTFGIE